MKIFDFVFLQLIFCIFSVIPNWKLSQSSINLLNSNNGYKHQYTIVENSMYNLKAKLERTIQKSGENITYTNKLTLDDVEKGNAQFEDIESQYNDNSISLLCPRGAYNPMKISDLQQLNFGTNWINSDEWNLKCYYHRAGHFLVFYLMNGKNAVKSTEDGGTNWNEPNIFNFYDEMYDFKFVNQGTTEYDYTQSPYPFMAIVKENNSIKLFNAKIEVGNSLIKINSGTNSTKELITAKNITKANFNNKDKNHNFYYITYNNISDFKSGFSIVTITGTNNFHEIVNTANIQNNEDNPFEFLEEVEIKEINFLTQNKYIYYSLYNKTNNKIYHGIFDITLNKIMYNTDEKINVFIPYSNNSMLAITDESAFRICAIFKDSNDNDCIEECPSGKIMLNTIHGNQCVEATTECSGDTPYTLIPEEICIDSCDELYFISDDNKKCGLCRDMNPTNQYKILNSIECISASNIPEGAEIYNDKLYLLQCKSGYILDDDKRTCVPHCYQTCATCTEYSTSESTQHCKTCIEGYFLENGAEDNNCLEIIPTTSVLTEPPTTFTPSTEALTSEALTTETLTTETLTTEVFTTEEPVIECSEENNEKCLKCDEESNKLGLCIECQEGFKKVNYTTLHPQYLDCLKSDDPILRSFFYEETAQEYKPCYKTCKKCITGGDAEEHNCTECISGYMFRPGNNLFNNCVVQSEFYYLSPYGQYKILNILQCPEESKYVIKDKKSCIDDCTKDEEYKYLYNGNCVKECPEKTTLENNICKVEEEKCTLGTNDLYLENNDLKVIDVLAKTYFSEFNYTNKHVSQYINENFTIVVYKTASCIKELLLEVPYINFQQCYIKVQRAYNITEDLIISIADRKIGSNAKTFYSFYHPFSGEKLNADEICKNDTIVVEENLMALLNENSSVYELQTFLTSQGINIFEVNDPFYTDICYDFDNPIKRDIPLNDRIKEIFPEAKLCDEKCQYKGIDLNNMIAKCDCTFNDITKNALINDNEFINNMAGEFFNFINSSNIQVFKCFQYMFKHFASSVGGWISLIFIICHIGMTLLYFLKEFNKLKLKIFKLMNDYINYLNNNKNKSLSNNNPPKKRIKNGKKSDNSLIVANIGKDFDIKSNDIKTNKKLVELTKKIKDDNDMERRVQFSSKLLPNMNPLNLNKKEETQNYLNSNEKNSSEFFEKYLSESFDNMEFDDALFYDKRTFREMFLECLHDKQMIASTFIAEDDLKPRSIKIILFILSIILYFVVNGFFFSEDVVSELYYIDENDENFFSYFSRSIERIIYSTLVSIVIGIITDFFFVEEEKLKGILIREKYDHKILKGKIGELINNIKIRNLAFIITASVLLLFSFFYLLCFNYVYPYTQIEWIKSSVTIVIIMQLLSILKCLYESGLRALSFKIKSEKMYKISKWLD